MKTHLRGKTMIKQKKSKVKQAVLPFVLETTYETITPRAGLIKEQINICLYQKVVEGTNQKTLFLLMLNACLPTGREGVGLLRI